MVGAAGKGVGGQDGSEKKKEKSSKSEYITRQIQKKDANKSKRKVATKERTKVKIRRISSCWETGGRSN